MLAAAHRREHIRKVSAEAERAQAHREDCSLLGGRFRLAQAATITSRSKECVIMSPS